MGIRSHCLQCWPPAGHADGRGCCHRWPEVKEPHLHTWCATRICFRSAVDHCLQQSSRSLDPEARDILYSSTCMLMTLSSSSNSIRDSDAFCACPTCCCQAGGGAVRLRVAIDEGRYANEEKTNFFYHAS